MTGTHDEARAPAPGVVTGRTGTLGSVFFVDRAFWPLNTTLFVADFRGHDPRFIAALLETLDLAALDDKAAIPGVHRDCVHALEVPRPPPAAQRRIARVLDRFDRRAALLRRMDLNLREMAVTAFQLLPRRRRRPVGELCDAIGNGATPRRGEPAFWDGGTIPWYRSGELSDGPLAAAAERVTEDAVARTACRVWPAGTVLVALYAMPTVGRLGVLAEPAAANQACCALVAKPAYGHGFLFHALLATRARLQRLSVGAVQQSISQRVVRDHEVDVPEPGEARAFHERVARLHELRQAYRREAEALATWRREWTKAAVRGRV